MAVRHCVHWIGALIAERGFFSRQIPGKNAEKIGPRGDPVGQWSIPDRASVPITNRWQDFPPWFDLYPTEVSNSLMAWMKARRSQNRWHSVKLNRKEIIGDILDPCSTIS